MFGYVTPDKPNLFMKDFVLFRANYCGVCHAMKKESGQFARLTVNYDVAFISAFFHDLLEQKPQIVMKGCVLNPKKRPIVAVSPLTRRIARLNLILAGIKIADDKADGEGTFLKRLVFSRAIKRARKKEPELASFADECFKKQLAKEQNGAFLNAAAEPFADMMKKVFGFLAGEKNSPSVEKLGYLLGKYVYFMDALDDYDEDVKKKRFNAFYRTFAASSFAELKKAKGEDLEFIMEDIVRGVEDAYRDVKMGENEGVVTNTLWYGLRSRISTVLSREDGKCTRIRL